MEGAELISGLEGNEVLHSKKVKRKSKIKNYVIAVDNMERVESHLEFEMDASLDLSEFKRKKKEKKGNVKKERVRTNSDHKVNGGNLNSMKVNVKKKKKMMGEESNISSGGDYSYSECEGGEVSFTVKEQLRKKPKKSLHTIRNMEGDESVFGHAECGESFDSEKGKLKTKKKKEFDTDKNMEGMESTSESEESDKISESIGKEEGKEKKRKGKKKPGERKKINKKKLKVAKKLNLPEVEFFHEMGLDDKLLSGIACLGWEKPSEIQLKAIPAILRGKDVIMEAETGSGKTGAFGIPVIQKIIDANKVKVEQTTRILIVVPSVELVTQTCRCIRQLSSQLSDITTCPLTNVLSVEQQVPLIELGCDIVVGTPCRVLEHLEAGNLKVTSVEMLVVDEADVVFFLGFEQAMAKIFRFMPKLYQTVMCTATVTKQLKSMALNTLYEPLFLRTKSASSWCLPEQLKHFYLHAKDDEKAFTLYAMLKLGLIKGRTLVFVNSVDKCYKVKLFLELFGIKSCVVNSELPALARMHAINQFNSEKYNLVIASDEFSEKTKKAKTAGKGSGKKKDYDDEEEQKDVSKEKKTKRKKDAEFNVSRGVDFQNVSNVLIFDFPRNIEGYIHRAGRTARMDNEGTVLSFVGPWQKSAVEMVDRNLRIAMNSQEPVIQQLQFNAEELDGFRYRSKDAWCAVTRVAVREARLMEIRNELFNCKALKGYFEDNPTDFNSLRHDKSLHTVKQQPHLYHVPDYIVPPALLRWNKGAKDAEAMKMEAENDWEVTELEAEVVEKSQEEDINPAAKWRSMTRSEKRHKRSVEDPLSAKFNFKRMRGGD